MSKAAIILITWYQKLLSPDHSFWGKHKYPFGYCRFAPTCSEYAKDAIARHGMIKGTLKTVFRIIRCNPFSAPAFDPIIK